MSADGLIAGSLGKTEEHGVRGPCDVGGLSSRWVQVSQQREKFLFGQSRKFRFDRS
jgi:hypothetical protein